MRFSLAPALLLAAFPLAAAPTITSISPGEGPSAGGTPVLIKGSGFAATGTILLSFGGLPAAAVVVVDANTITARTPQHLPGVVDVFYSQPDGSSALRDGFRFTGNVTDSFDRLLVPLMLPPISGAFDSRFVTYLSLWNPTAEEMTVYGAGPVCYFPVCFPPESPRPLPPRSVETINDIAMSGTAVSPGRFLFVSKGSGPLLAAELRAQDVSRQAQTWGTSVPVVRDMRSAPVALLDIPNDARFRNTLRVYGDTDGGTVRVRIVQTSPPWGVIGEFALQLTPGATTFDPSYAPFSAFPAPPPIASPGIVILRVEVEPVTPDLRIWAFVSVTNNETQHITLIAP